MTIDELDVNTINIDEATECLFATGEFEDKDEAKNAVNSALELIEELKWWRSQDLIRREDVAQAVETVSADKILDHVKYIISRVDYGESDLISRKKVIKAIKKAFDDFCTNAPCYAVKASINKIPRRECRTCENERDLIRREDAIKAIEETYAYYECGSVDEEDVIYAIERIDNQ